MNKSSGISENLTAVFSEWINRCYTSVPDENSMEQYMGRFCNNLCSAKGIYGAWLHRYEPAKSDYTIFASFCHSAELTDQRLTKSVRKHFGRLSEPWKLFSSGFRSSHFFTGHSADQPENELAVYMISGFTFEGQFVLTLIAETQMEGLLSVNLPAMLRNIFEIARLKFENTESFYRLLIENQNDLVVKVDAEGRFLFVSPSYCRTFGLSPGQLIGRSYVPLIHPDDRKHTADQVAKLADYPHSCYIEQRARTVKGWRWIAWSDNAVTGNDGKILAIIGVGRDITEQKTVEQELLESETKFQKAFRNSPNLMLITRLKDGLVYDINNRFLSMIGMNREEIIGKTTKEMGLYRLFSRSKVVKSLKQDGRIEERPISIYVRDKKLDGVFSTELIELKGEKCMVSSFLDITDLKRAQQELLDYRMHLETLVEQRTVRIREINEELDRFARSVSHDLKAPVRVMQGFAMALIEDHAQNLNPDGLNYLNRIKKASLQMEELINDLLEYSRLSSLELDLSPVNPVDAVYRAMEQLKSEIARKKARIYVSENLPMVISYKPVLVQVLINLFSNSLMFVGIGVTPEIRVDGQVEEGKAFIRVKDNGIGIPKDKQKRIFEVFERLHGVESFPGTGIGLTIVKKAMERMGGAVRVISAPGKGSIFELELQSSMPV